MNPLSIPIEIAIKVAEFVQSNLEKLGNWVLGNPSPSSLGSGADSGYSPPTEGGQCAVPYNIDVRITRKSDGQATFIPNYAVRNGALSVVTEQINSRPTLCVASPSQTLVIGDYTDVNDVQFTFRRVDNLPDNCGNQPNPNPSSPQDNPVPSGGSPVGGSPSVVDGGSSPLPTPLLPSVPNDTVDASLPSIALAIGNALKALKDVVDLANSLIDLFDKLKKKELGEKKIELYPLGNVDRDGYISLLGFVSQEKVPLYLTVFVYQRPNYLGKWLGIKSPHRYESPLGYIMPVDSQFCVIDAPLSVRFVRQSVTFPSGTIGFYYHFGLMGKNKVQLSLTTIEEI